MPLSAAGYYYHGASAEAHWPLLLAWFSGSVASCFLIMAAARWLLPRAAPSTWATMVDAKPWQAVAVPKNVTEWWPAFVTPVLVWRDTRALTLAALATPAEALHLPPPPGVWSATGAALGYMVYDCVAMAVWSRDLHKSMGAAMYMQLWFHHIFSLLFWPYALHSSAAGVFVSWFLLSEVSNIFLNARTLLLKMQRTSGAPFLIASALFLVSFFAVRIAPIPFLAAVWYRADWSRTTTGTFGVTALTTPLPVVLNIYWFSLALKGAVRLLRPAPKKQA